MQTELLQNAANEAEIAPYRPTIVLNYLLLGGVSFYLFFISNTGRNDVEDNFSDASCSLKRVNYPADLELAAVPKHPERILVRDCDILQFGEALTPLSWCLKPQWVQVALSDDQAWLVLHKESVYCSVDKTLSMASLILPLTTVPITPVLYSSPLSSGKHE